MKYTDKLNGLHRAQDIRHAEENKERQEARHLVRLPSVAQLAIRGGLSDMAARRVRESLVQARGGLATPEPAPLAFNPFATLSL
jgi:hypothetical protein